MSDQQPTSQSVSPEQYVTFVLNEATRLLDHLQSLTPAMKELSDAFKMLAQAAKEEVSETT